PCPSCGSTLRKKPEGAGPAPHEYAPKPAVYGPPAIPRDRRSEGMPNLPPHEYPPSPVVYGPPAILRGSGRKGSPVLLALIIVALVGGLALLTIYLMKR